MNPERVWHPLVHARYQERLAFYAIQFDQPTTADVLSDAAELMAAVPELVYYCQYPMYGAADVLFRVWANDVAQRKLRRRLALAADDGHVLAYNYFEVESIAYLWAGRHENLLAPNSDLSARIPGVDAAIRDIAGRGRSLSGPSASDNDAMSDLLLVRDVRREESSVKFFITMSAMRKTIAQSRLEFADLVNRLVLRDLVEGVSVYGGIGRMGDYLVKGSVANYEDLAAWTTAFDGVLADFKMRGTTLLVAPVDGGVESDNINTFGIASIGTQDAADFLRLDTAGELDQLAPESKLRLEKVVREAEVKSANNVELRNLLQTVLGAAFQKDELTLGASLWFLLEVEWLFRRIAIDEYTAHWGQGFIPALGTLLQNAQSNNASDMAPGRWTLGKARDIASDAASADEALGLRLTRRFGSNWEVTSRKAVEVRNAYAHGQLVSQLVGGLGDSDDLTKLCGKLIDTAVWHSQLRREAGLGFVGSQGEPLPAD